MTNQTVTRGTSNVLMNLSYSYDRGNSKGTLNKTTGQLTKIVDNKDGNKNRVYEFDTLGRLMTAKGGTAAGAAYPATASWTQNYGYDRYGNKKTTTNTGYTANNQAIPLDGLPSQSFDDTTNRINEAGYDYDKAGNVIRGKAPNGSWQKYEYDTAGRLRFVRDDTGWIQQSNEYASSRQRLASWSYASADITYYAWGGSSVLAEYTTQYSSSTLTWQKSYVYAGSRLLSTITNTSGNEVTEYHHPDRLGTRLISNPTTATQNEQLTLPFGTLIGAETSATNDKRFTSYDRSEIAGGLDYAVNRNYNSGQSRFTQVDPIGMASASIGDPQSMNMFAYVQNNPIDFIDPSGLLMAIPQRQIGWLELCWILGICGNPRSSGDSGGDDIPGGAGSGGGSSPEPSPPASPAPDCNKITQAIKNAYNSVLKRFRDFKKDSLDFIPRGLITRKNFEGYLSTLNASVNIEAERRKGYYDGHVEQFRNQQKRISQGLKDYDDNDCNNQLPNRRNLRQASKLGVPNRTRPIEMSPLDSWLKSIRNSLPQIPPFPTDKQIEEFYKKYPRIIPLPGRRIPITP